MTVQKLELNRGEIVAKKYEVLDKLGENPLGMFYRAKHLSSGKFIRIAMLRSSVANSSNQDELLAAFNTAKSANHPNILEVGELDEHEGVAFFTMEDFDGVLLRDLMQQYKAEGRRFTTKEAAQITVQTITAVLSFHEKSLVHRAIRPENLLVNLRFTGPRQDNVIAKVKLIGVGMWSLVQTSDLIEAEFAQGAAQYIAPELRGIEPVSTVRSDVYSIGVVLYEMLTGTAPVGTFQLPSTIRDDIPPHLDDIIESALAHSPDDRYQTAKDFGHDIKRLFEQGAMVTEEPGATSKVPLLLGLLTLTTIIILGLLLFGDRTDPIQEAQAQTNELRKQVAERRFPTPPEQLKTIIERHPQNMAYVPPGPYLKGRMHFDPTAPISEPMAEEVFVDGFMVDIFEFPNQPGGQAMAGVSQVQAAELCKSAGKRLCSADEWETACKGPMNYIYGYGDTFDSEFCGDGLESRGYPSGTLEKCRSGWKVFDMAGNLREWVADNPAGKPNRGIVKGGFRHHPEKGTRCAFSTDESNAFKDASMGFRCCRHVDAPPVGASTDVPPPPPPPPPIK